MVSSDPGSNLEDGSNIYTTMTVSSRVEIEPRSITVEPYPPEEELGVGRSTRKLCRAWHSEPHAACQPVPRSTAHCTTGVAHHFHRLFVADCQEGALSGAPMTASCRYSESGLPTPSTWTHRPS